MLFYTLLQQETYHMYIKYQLQKALNNLFN